MFIFIYKFKHFITIYMKTKQQIEETYGVEWVNIEFVSETGCSTCAMAGKGDCPFRCENTLGFFIKRNNK